MDGENKTKTWSQKILFPEPGGGEYVTKLAVKQILLGHDAKKDEVNVVEVTTDGWSRDGTLQKIPIAVLKLGETQSSLPNLEFPSLAVKFTLTVGSGPVHITGLQFPDAFSDNKGDHEVSKKDVLLRRKIQITIYAFQECTDEDGCGDHHDDDEGDEEEDEDEEVEDDEDVKPISKGGKKK